MQQQNSMLSKISALTTLDAKLLCKLSNTVGYVICDTVAEDSIASNEVTEVDIGIGTLIVKHGINEVRYKFIPSQKLNDAVIYAVKTKESPLTSVLENKLVMKLKDTYKDLI